MIMEGNRFKSKIYKLLNSQNENFKIHMYLIFLYNNIIL